MRKITQKTAAAFMSGGNFKQRHDIVETDSSGKSFMFYRNNLIAVHYPANKHGETVKVTLAGWNTSTTRERLNGIPGVHVNVVKGIPYINGNRWDVDVWFRIVLTK